MTHRSQNGSALAIVTVVLAVALAGTLGWLAYQNFIVKEPAKTASGAETAKKSDAQNPSDATAAEVTLKKYKSPSHNYSIGYPSDWLLVPESKAGGVLYIRNFDPNSKPAAPRENGTNYPKGYINIAVSAATDDANFKDAHGGLDVTEWYNRLGESTVTAGAVTYEPSDVTDVVKPIGVTTGKVAKAEFSETDEVIYVLAANGTLYEISLFPYGTSSNATVARILDSFRIE